MITIKKSFSIIILLLVVVSIISGCGSSRAKSGSKTGNGEKNESKAAPGSKLSFDVIQNMVETQGTYVGEIDGNSVEIIVEGEPRAFRHEGRYREVLDGLKENDELSISYFENEHGQLILVTFKKLK